MYPNNEFIAKGYPRSSLLLASSQCVWNIHTYLERRDVIVTQRKLVAGPDEEVIVHTPERGGVGRGSRAERGLKRGEDRESGEGGERGGREEASEALLALMRKSLLTPLSRAGGQRNKGPFGSLLERC